MVEPRRRTARIRSNLSALKSLSPPDYGIPRTPNHNLNHQASARSANFFDGVRTAIRNQSTRKISRRSLNSRCTNVLRACDCNLVWLCRGSLSYKGSPRTALGLHADPPSRQRIQPASPMLVGCRIFNRKMASKRSPAYLVSQRAKFT